LRFCKSLCGAKAIDIGSLLSGSVRSRGGSFVCLFAEGRRNQKEPVAAGAAGPQSVAEFRQSLIGGISLNDGVMAGHDPDEVLQIIGPRIGIGKNIAESDAAQLGDIVVLEKDAYN